MLKALNEVLNGQKMVKPFIIPERVQKERNSERR